MGLFDIIFETGMKFTWKFMCLKFSGRLERENNEF
jgi:hypothetical protein